MTHGASPLFLFCMRGFCTGRRKGGGVGRNNMSEPRFRGGNPGIALLEQRVCPGKNGDIKKHFFFFKCGEQKKILKITF